MLTGGVPKRGRVHQLQAPQDTLQRAAASVLQVPEAREAVRLSQWSVLGLDLNAYESL